MCDLNNKNNTGLLRISNRPVFLLPSLSDRCPDHFIQNFLMSICLAGRLFMLFHRMRSEVFLDRRKGRVADIMLHLAGVLRRGLLIHAEAF